MNEFLYSISFRASFFSLPTFMNNYVSTLAELYPDASFKEMPVSQTESQLIDIDTIASELDVPIVNLLEQKNYVFEKIVIGGTNAKVYITPYYVYVYIPVNENVVIGETLVADVDRILSTERLQKTMIQEYSCQVNHYLNLRPSEIFKNGILDKDAFPQLYPEEISTGRFSDSHLTDEGYELKLIRDILKGKDLDSEEPYLGVNILSIASTKSTDCNFNTLYELALTEAARCFK